jgi:hypothetical protein
MKHKEQQFQQHHHNQNQEFTTYKQDKTVQKKRFTIDQTFGLTP